MSTVPPPTAPVPPPTGQVPQGGPVAILLNPPPAVATLPPGAALDGIVQPQHQANADPGTPANVVIRTAGGDVTLRLPVALPAGADVALQVVRTSGDQTTVRVVTINDQPAGQVLMQLRQNAATASAPPLPPVSPANLPGATQPLPPANAWTPQGPTSLPALGTISAYVVQGTPAAAPSAVAAPNPSTPNIAALLNIAPPGANSGAGAFGTDAGGDGNASANAGGGNAGSNDPKPGPSAPPALTLITSGELSVRITQVTLPEATLPAMPPTPGTVSAQTPAAAQSAPASTASVIVDAPSSSPAPPTGSAPLVAGAMAPQVLPGPAMPAIAAGTAPVVMQDDAEPLLILTGPQTADPVSVPPPPPAAVDSPPPQITLTGVVTSTDPAAAPVITTDLGQIQLNVRANLPLGTRVVFEIGAQMPPQPGATPPSTPLAALPLSGPPLAGAAAGWPTLNEAVAVLQRSDPAAASQLAAAIPDGGPRTVVALMAFVQAMRSGDARQWPGNDPLRALERAGPRGAHLAGQLNDEVSALSTRAREPGAGAEWRMLPVPWNADGRIDRIALITRREDGEDPAGGKKRGGGGTRFLINLDLSRLGAIQLDGMFRKESRGFDMMMRTKAPLPETMRHDLTGLFAASTAAMGLQGGLTFQVVRKFPDPIGDTPSTDKPGLWA